MNPKVEKLRNERAACCEKISKLQERVKEIDELVLKLENSDIVGMIRDIGMTPDELAELLKAHDNDKAEVTNEQA